MKNSFGSFLALVVAVVLGLGCTESVASPQDGGGTKNAPARPAQAQPATRVAKIVFIGKEHACDCTKGRVDGSWAQLQKALGRRRDIPIERLQVDTDRARVSRYEAMRAIMVIPAVYFLDASGALIDVLQGEITAEQFGRALRAAPPRKRP